MTLSWSSQCRAFSRAVMDEKSLSPLFPVGGGGGGGGGQWLQMTGAYIMAYLDEHKLLSYRQHAFRKRHSCGTQSITVINDWAKSCIRADKLTHLSWTSRKLLIHPLMNYLKASCMIMVLVERL